MTESATETHRKEVFRRLVEAQDQGDAVKDSRTRVAAEFSLSLEEVTQIERDGISASWPPLQ